MLTRREADSRGLQDQLQSYNERIEMLETQKQQLHGDVAKRSEHAEVISRENENLQRQIR